MVVNSVMGIGRLQQWPCSSNNNVAAAAGPSIAGRRAGGRAGGQRGLWGPERNRSWFGSAMGNMWFASAINGGV